VHHAAVKQRSNARERLERRSRVETALPVPLVADAALPRGDRARTLVCTSVWLAAAGLSLGAACGISVGRLGAARHRLRRKDSFQLDPFRPLVGVPVFGSGGLQLLSVAWRFGRSGWHVNEYDHIAQSRKVLQHAG